MKRISKLMALLLAIALVLSVAVPAIATEEKKEDISSLEYNTLFFGTLESMYNSLLAADSLMAYLDCFPSLDEESFRNFEQALTEEQLAVLYEHLDELVMKLTFEELCAVMERLNLPTDDLIVTPPVNYAAVADLAHGPVETGRAMRLMSVRALSEDEEEENGLILNKEAVSDGNGGYKITLEAYTTGSVTTNTTSVPTDIVLVLDESGSMKNSIYSYTEVYPPLPTSNSYYVEVHGTYYELQPSWFSDNWYYWDGNNLVIVYPKESVDDDDPNHQQVYTREGVAKSTALKNAANTFVDNVYKDAVANDVDHRISVIGFAGSASTYIGLVDDIRNNKANVTNAINNLKTNGGTYIEKGLSQAISAFDNASATPNTPRNRVVVIFTDGIPGSGYWYDNTTISGSANPAIASANELKNKYGATVYTIGMLSGANPAAPIDMGTSDDARTNRFLHFLSSNYPNATNMDNGGTGGNKGYYLAASDSSTLNEIFEKISQKIQTPTMELGTETVVKDIVTPYFNMPSNTSAIKLYTAAYDGTAFGERVSANNLNVAIDPSTQTVSVTGFDYNANFVSETAKSDGSYGKELIIEFTVTPKTDFLGGNGVPTNGAASGVYADSNAETAVEYFDEPAVDVPVKTITPDVQDQNIYLTNAASLTELVKDMGKFTVDDTSYTVDGTNNAYVNITYTIKDASGNVIATYTIPAGTNASGLAGIVWKDANGNEISSGSAVLNPSDLTNDTVYTITCTVAPLPKAEGEGAGVSSAEGSGTATVNVFKPEITFQDSVEDYLSTHTFPDYYTDTTPTGGNNYVSTVWKHNDTSSSAEGIVIKGEEPTLNLTYTVAGTDIKMETDEETGTIIAMQDIPVNVTVAVNKANPSVQGSTSWDITANTTFVHEECDLEFDSTCTWDPNWTSHAGNATKPEPESSESIPEFLIHVKNIVADLTIKKTGLDVYAYKDSDGKVTDEDRESAIITVKATGKDGSEVIYRFALANNQSVTIKDLKVGSTYTVAEENGWTWRYQNYGGYNGTIVMNPNNAPNTNKVTINNTANNPYWLGGDNYAVNVFGTASAGTGH